MAGSEVLSNIDSVVNSYRKHNAQTGMRTKYFDGNSVLDPQIDDLPSEDLSLVVVVPTMNETDLLRSLEALKHCQKPKSDVEVIVVINHCAGTSPGIVETNQHTLKQAGAWASLYSTQALRFHILYHPDLAAKKGGVGMARKIGMDEAARRLLKAGNAEGVIACFDADCLCAPDYLQALTDYFKAHAGIDGVSIHFEHPLERLGKNALDAIVNYELHLRYFINAQRWAHFPFAYQTVGSSMAVRACTYIKVGGMNTRKAGEDFYFLHKVIECGRHADLTATTVFPSARSSDRVPFGTGKAIADLLGGASATTYNPRSFEDLRVFISFVPGFYSASAPDHIIDALPESIQEFLTTQEFAEILEEIKINTASDVSFEKRVFRWFNAFRLMKYVHFARDAFYPDVTIDVATDWLFKELNIDSEKGLYSRLIQLREFDKDTAC
jgi:cellulose synthase/poly-beta-1,6-N-acetylglucosamine synthase-like glycosyltransferase